MLTCYLSGEKVQFVAGQLVMAEWRLGNKLHAAPMEIWMIPIHAKQRYKFTKAFVE